MEHLWWLLLNLDRNVYLISSQDNKHLNETFESFGVFTDQRLVMSLQ